MREVPFYSFAGWEQQRDEKSNTDLIRSTCTTQLLVPHKEGGTVME